MFEIEIKAIIENQEHQAQIESRLQKLGAIKQVNEVHSDAVYGQKGKFPPQDGGVIARIRNKNGKIIFAIKEIDRNNGGIELENEIKEIPAYHNLLLKLGFEHFFTIEKERTKYKLTQNDNQFTIDIDNVKDLGTFIEVELLVATVVEKELATKKCYDLIELIAPGAIITKKKLGDYMAKKIGLI